jgi:hypothetical protein
VLGKAASSAPSFVTAAAAELQRSAALGRREWNMTFIDWSDSEGMFDLLLEFLRDEKNACAGDAARQGFLAGLLLKVISAKELAPTKAINQLRAIHDSIDGEFKDDPAFLHIEHLIEELERIS